MHDAAHEAARQVVAMIAPSATDDELKELFSKVYDALMAMLRKYEERAERRMKRLGKS
jgi:hypothetical protein